jgi:hypothetical protein
VVGRVGPPRPVDPADGRGGKAHVEVSSDGTKGGTRVFLVLEDDEGHLFRYRIPAVLSIGFTIGYGAGHEGDAQLLLGLGSVRLHAAVTIAPGKSTVEDLLTEISAVRLANDRTDDR